MYKFVFLLCCINVAVLAYDFKDSHYNELLMQDLIESSGESQKIYLPQLRHRRDADSENDDKKCNKPKKNALNKCCDDNNEADAEVHYEKYKEWKRQCTQEIRGGQGDNSVDVFSCEKLNKTKTDLVCIAQCIGQKANIVDENGGLIEDAVKDHIKTQMASSQWQKDAADDISQKCIDEVREAMKNEQQPSGDDDKKCSMSALKLGHCLWREFTKSCPQEFQSTSPKCQKIRQSLENGEKYEFGSYHRYHAVKSDMEDSANSK